MLDVRASDAFALIQALRPTFLLLSAFHWDRRMAREALSGWEEEID